jgi:hypothetical protein
LNFTRERDANSVDSGIDVVFDHRTKTRCIDATVVVERCLKDWYDAVYLFVGQMIL